MDDLKVVRNRINAIDDTIMALLEERFDLAEQIGVYKMTNKLPIYNADREQDILDKTSSFSHFPHIKEVYGTIMKESKKLQRK